MMLQVRNFNQLLLTALLVGAVSTAFASGPPYGDNLDYAMNGTTLVLTSPDPTDGEQHLNLFLGGGNELFWPTDGDKQIKAW